MSHRHVCLDNCRYSHTETEVAEKVCRVTQSQYTDTGPTRLSAITQMPVKVAA